MTLKEQISQDLKTSMKEKDTVRLSVLRVLKGEIERGEQTPQGKVEMPDAEIIKVVKKISEGVKATTNDQKEISILDSYLPVQLDEATILHLIDETKHENTSVGAMMAYFKKNFDGQYDGKIVSNLTKQLLA